MKGSEGAPLQMLRGAADDGVTAAADDGVTAAVGSALSERRCGVSRKSVCRCALPGDGCRDAGAFVRVAEPAATPRGVGV
jgi:hypothetical protein